MSENGAYDIKMKLLEIQNQLIKGAHQKPDSSAPVPEAPVAAKENPGQPGDTMSILQELLKNQKIIIRLLNEINSKIK